MVEGRQSGYEEAGQRRGEKGKHGGGQVSPQGGRGEADGRGETEVGRENTRVYMNIYFHRCIIYPLGFC